MCRSCGASGQSPPSGGYWRDANASSDWPLDEPSVTRFAVLVDGKVRGLVQYAEEDDETGTSTLVSKPTSR